MRIGPIAFRDELLAAQNEGNLVVFAGTGVSRGAPSKLPTFEELAREIAGGAYDRNRDGPEDQFLGGKDKQGIPVHQRAREILGDRGSEPTQLHYLLLELFSSRGPVRLVTTNFDRHFTTVANEICGPDLEVFYAPALPLGSDFKGIVYLHGSVDRKDDPIVLTDKDFGRAYLTEGWATRFLLGLFQNYSVLFVGYSHNDVIVSYLARGLPPGAKSRFALIPSDQKGPNRWNDLGVTPIPYANDGDHSALSAGIQKWVEDCRRGALDHEQRIRTIVSIPPPLDPEEADYIRSALRDPVKTQFFTRYAVSVEWLKWSEGQEAFKSLFRPDDPRPLERGQPRAQITAYLASWFARNFATQYPDAALYVLQRLGGRLHTVLWDAIASHLNSTDLPPTPETLAKWLGVLLPPSPGHAHTFLWGLLQRCQPQQDAATPLELFDFLTTPRLVMTKRLFVLPGESEEQVDWDVVLTGWDNPHISSRAANAYELNEAWRNLFQPNLALFAKALAPLLTSRLRQTHLLFRAVGKGDQRQDPLSQMQQSIEGSGEPLWEFAVLVNAARDVLDWMLSNDPERADSLIEEWITSDVPLLKRLAIFGLGRNPRFNADTKIARVLKTDVIYALTPDREVTQLIERQYAGASADVRKSLVAKLLQPPTDLDEPQRSYLAYAMLMSLAESDPDCDIVQSGINQILTEHPEFKVPTEHSIPDEWFSLAGAASVAQPDEAKRLLALDPKVELEDLVTYVITKDDWALTTRMANVTAAASERFEWGEQLAQSLIETEEWDSELWRAIIRAWRTSASTDIQRGQIISLLLKLPPLDRFAGPIADLLVHWWRPDNAADPSAELLADAEKLADRLWTALGSETAFAEQPKNGWLHEAINYPASQTVQFWLYALSLVRKRAGYSWPGAMPKSYSERLESVVNGKSKASQLGGVVLASQVRFLFAIDPTWTKQNVLPLLDFSVDPECASQAWDGFLSWGSWDEAILPGLLPLYIGAFPHFLKTKHSKTNRFCEHLAHIALFGSINPIRHGWLNKFVDEASDPARAAWAAYVGQVLRSLPDDRVSYIWEVWLGAYFAQRAKGYPVPLSNQEIARMVEWLPYLTKVFSAAVDIVCKSPRPALEYSGVFAELLERKVASEDPEELAKLLSYLLPGVPDGFSLLSSDLENLVKNIPAGCVSSSDLKRICNELARIGCPNAAAIFSSVESKESRACGSQPPPADRLATR